MVKGYWLLAVSFWLAAHCSFLLAIRVLVLTTALLSFGY